MTNKQKLSKLSILPVNKTTVFYSPIDGQDVFVRTGIVENRLCFIHALFHAFSREYIRQSESERIRTVKKFYKNLGEQLEEKRWEKSNKSMVAKIPYQDCINNVFNEFYRVIQNGEKTKDKSCKYVIRNVLSSEKAEKAYKIIAEIVSADTICKDLISKIMEKYMESPLNECSEQIKTEIHNYLSNELDKLGKGLENRKKEYCLEKMDNLVHEILKEAENVSLNEYAKDSQTGSLVVDKSTVEILSNKIRRNIYFIDCRTRMPYKILDNMTRHKKSVIILWLGGLHYEVVGRLYESNKVQRDFYSDDVLIRRLHMFVYNPARIYENYPNLVSYLPKKYREDIGFYSSRSDKEYSSSHSSYSDSESVSSKDSESVSSKNSEMSKYESSRRYKHRRH